MVDYELTDDQAHEVCRRLAELAEHAEMFNLRHVLAQIVADVTSAGDAADDS